MTENKQPGPEKLLKVIFVGNSGVGKTCLLSRMFSDTFNANCPATVGCDFKLKDLEFEGKRVRLCLWDTAGQERFQAITSSYYRGADGVVYVYDVTQRDTFEALRHNWMHQVAEYCCKPNMVELILANKIDLVAERQVTTEEGAQLGREAGCLYQEASAKTDDGVYDAFMWGLVYTMLEGGGGEDAPEQEGIKLTGSKPQDKGGCC